MALERDCLRRQGPAAQVEVPEAALGETWTNGEEKGGVRSGARVSG